MMGENLLRFRGKEELAGAEIPYFCSYNRRRTDAIISKGGLWCNDTHEGLNPAAMPPSPGAFDGDTLRTRRFPAEIALFSIAEAEAEAEGGADIPSAAIEDDATGFLFNDRGLSSRW